PEGMKLEGKVADKRSKNLDVNEYDREYYRYNTHFPLINFGFNPDDGFAIGAGLLSTLHGFRKEPYAAFHSVGFSVFTATGAFNFNYSGDFTGALGKSDLIVDASILNPEFVNFFGFGTNSVNPLAGFNFNRVRLEHYRLGLSSRWRLNGNRNTLRFGPVLETISLSERDNQIMADPNFPEVPLQDFSFKHFAGANLQFSIDGTDGKANIRNGLRITADADYRKRLDSGDDNSGFLRTGGAFSLYLTIPIKSVDVTLASSVGGDYTFGDFEFYQAPSLGGFRNLRGYRNDRFRGHARWYHNTDLRLTLFYWDNAILPFEFGMYGGVDYGQIYFRDEENPNDELFVGYAAGVFFNPLKFLVITPFMAFSEEQ
ncbi:MAG: ShlB/FhaC/HecB family hemolysin secretion/activation protein, partial [Bacteroidota bacterium]